MCLSAEYKKARQEIKKRSSDTLKLQKKAKKGLSSPSCLVTYEQLLSSGVNKAIMEKKAH